MKVNWIGTLLSRFSTEALGMHPACGTSGSLVAIIDFSKEDRKVEERDWKDVMDGGWQVKCCKVTSKSRYKFRWMIKCMN